MLTYRKYTRIDVTQALEVRLGHILLESILGLGEPHARFNIPLQI